MNTDPRSDTPADDAGATAAGRAARFGRLPARILPEQMVESRPASSPNDPRFGRDPDTDWLIRYCA